MALVNSTTNELCELIVPPSVVWKGGGLTLTKPLARDGVSSIFNPPVGWDMGRLVWVGRRDRGAWTENLSLITALSGLGS